MGLPGPLRGEPMLFLLSLVGEGGAGFPICNSHIKSILIRIAINLKHHARTCEPTMSSLCRERPGVSVWNLSVWFLMWSRRALAVKDQQLLIDRAGHAWSAAGQSQAITLVLLYTELSVKAAFIMLVGEVMSERRLMGIAPQITGQTQCHRAWRHSVSTEI